MLKNIFGPGNPLRLPLVFLIIVPIFRRKAVDAKCKDNSETKTESSNDKKGGDHAG